MSFPQLGYPQYLSASQAVYGSERPGVLTPSSRGGSNEIGGSPSATAAAVTSVLGMYANPYAHNYSAFLPYTSADLALFSQMVRINVCVVTVYDGCPPPLPDKTAKVVWLISTKMRKFNRLQESNYIFIYTSPKIFA